MVTRPTIIRSSSFGGAPPRQLLEQIACEVVSDERNSIDGVVDQTADDLRYTPRSYTDHRIDELFSDLQSGHRDYLPYETLTRLDPSIQSPRQYLRDRLDGRAILLKHGAVPVVYVGRAADSLRRDLVQHGYIALDVCVQTRPMYPRHVFPSLTNPATDPGVLGRGRTRDENHHHPRSLQRIPT